MFFFRTNNRKRGKMVGIPAVVCYKGQSKSVLGQSKSVLALGGPQRMSGVRLGGPQRMSGVRLGGQSKFFVGGHEKSILAIHGRSLLRLGLGLSIRGATASRI
jgi:hypothetical protein